MDINKSDEVSTAAFFACLWKGKFEIALITVISITITFFFAINLPNLYQANTILAPVSKSENSSLSALAGQFSGFASLAGLNLGQGIDQKATIAVEVLTTWDFLEKVVEDHNVKAEIYAAKDWNKTTRTLVYDDDIYDAEANSWNLEDQLMDSDKQPKSWYVYKKLRKNINVSRNKNTGFITITFEHYSPEFTKKMLDILVKSINLHIKSKDTISAQKNIEFLKDQISKTGVTALQAVFYKLIEEQAKILMLAEAADEYVLKTISPAKTPEVKSKPRRALILCLGMFAGLMIGMFVALLRHSLK